MQPRRATSSARRSISTALRAAAARASRPDDTKEGDFLQHLFVASTHDYFLFFSDRGRVYWRKVYQLPQFGRTARGRALVNVIKTQVAEGERITRDPAGRETSMAIDILLTATQSKGLIKKTAPVRLQPPEEGWHHRGGPRRGRPH